MRNVGTWRNLVAKRIIPSQPLTDVCVCSFFSSFTLVRGTLCTHMCFSCEEQVKQFQAEGGKEGKEAPQGVIPTDTKLNISLKSNMEQGTVELHLMTSNFSVIRAVAIFAEHLFDGEACMLHPIPPSNNVIVQISPAKDIQTMMHVKAMAAGDVDMVNSLGFWHLWHTSVLSSEQFAP